MQTKPFGDPAKCRVMIIGHDPRLQRSATIASHCLFADYYFLPKPASRAERAKYDLAALVFEIVDWLTFGCVAPAQVLVTNLCNKMLPSAPRGQTVLIPENMAKQGIAEINELLEGSTVTVVLAMSLQVNYWLQRLNFCEGNAEFLKRASPKKAGLDNNLPYYEAETTRAFILVCGNRYEGPNGVSVYPILHAKNWRCLKASYGEYHEVARCKISKELEATGACH